MDVISFRVVGSSRKIKNLIEYIELLGYYIERYYSNYGSMLYINKKLNYIPAREIPSSGCFNITNDAEKINDLLHAPNKNLTDARDEFFEELNNIEVNEPVEIKTEGENLVFKDNQTLNKSQQVVEDLLGRDWVGNTTLNTRVWRPWEIEKEKTPEEIESFEDFSKRWDECKKNSIINDALKNLKDTQGVKHNQGKLPIDTVLTKQFPKAVEALVQCSVYGHEKYNKNGEDEDWLNFKRVEGGSQTYADAAARHNQNKSEKDEESGINHIFHKLWNTMAEVELWIEENHKE